MSVCFNQFLKTASRVFRKPCNISKKGMGALQKFQMKIMSDLNNQSQCFFWFTYEGRRKVPVWCVSYHRLEEGRVSANMVPL